MKKNNILIFKEHICVSGNQQYFIYDFEFHLLKEITINYNISCFKIHSNGDIICGGEKGEIFVIENLYDGEVVFLDLTKHQNEIKSIINIDKDIYISNDKQFIRIWSLKPNQN